MKLELKHLAPYLSYQLKIYITEDFKNPYSMRPIQEKGNIVTFDSYGILLAGAGLKFKPILQPLSDLTKEIEINGERFVPIDKLKELFVSNLDCGANCEGKWNIWLNQKTPMSLNVLAISEIKEKLFEWHFDVFGLIDQGLAIDINTLKL